MTKLEQDTLKKTELKNLFAIVSSTVTILIGIFLGGSKMKDEIIDSIRSEFRAEIRGQINEYKLIREIKDNEQLHKDKEQDKKIDDIKIYVDNLQK